MFPREGLNQYQPRNTMTRNHASIKNQDKIYVDNSNKEIILQLEAIKSHDASRPSRKVKQLENMNEDDGIQRVVSQVRKFENESGEGTNQNLKFEIERTDSLEFTRNSASDSQVQADLSSQNSGSSKEGPQLINARKRQRGVLNTTQDEADQFKEEEVITAGTMLNPAAVQVTDEVRLTDMVPNTDQSQLCIEGDNDQIMHYRASDNQPF